MRNFRRIPLQTRDDLRRYLRYLAMETTYTSQEGGIVSSGMIGIERPEGDGGDVGGLSEILGLYGLLSVLMVRPVL